MRIYQADNIKELNRKAANLISAQMILKPDSVLGLATGASPIGVYKQLIDWYRKGDLDFAGIRTVNLDEYKGLGPEDPQSYHYYMQEQLFSAVNLRQENTYLPDGTQEDERTACEDYDALIRQLGGIDLQLLGIGRNGHIGFNEPGEAFIRNTHCVRLSESTIQANARFFASREDVPEYAYTMGIGDILQAKRVVLIAFGEEKARACYEAFTGPITPQLPASILQLHPNVSLVADRAALSLFAQGEYTL